MSIEFNSPSAEEYAEDERMVSSLLTNRDEQENTLRPKTLSEYTGQDKVKDQLRVYIEAARSRNEPLDHVLLYGPPGLGKTTLATIIANEMGVNIRTTSGPAIEKTGDLAALLTSLNEGDILFIDEIHRLNRSIEEILYCIPCGFIRLRSFISKPMDRPMDICIGLRAYPVPLIYHRLSPLAGRGIIEIHQVFSVHFP